MVNTWLVYLIMVVMGGLGSITGSIAGAFVVTGISAALAGVPEFRMIIYSIILILLMFYRPQGLFGYVEITNLPLFRYLKNMSPEAKKAMGIDTEDSGKGGKA